MIIGYVINDIATEKDHNTTVQLAMLLYPDPAADVAQVILPGAGGDLAIVDATGRCISVQRTWGPTHSLDLGRLKSGAYWLRWTGTDGATSGLRFMKQ